MLVAVVFAVAAMAFMAWRGPMRALEPGEMINGHLEYGGSSDFSLMWQSTRAWAEGSNPYSSQETLEIWRAHSGEPAGVEAPSERVDDLLVYPPPTFVLLAPWCLTDWATSRLLWTVLNTLLLGGSVVLVLGLAGLSPRGAAWWFAFGAAILMAPGHTSISVGQVSILTVFLIALAHALRAQGSPPGYPGILIGVACCLKPQIGLLFLAYEFGRKRWGAAFVAMLTIAIVSAVGVWWLWRAGIDWVPKWQSNVQAFANSNNANPTESNPLRYHLINLHYLLHGFIPSVDTVKWLVYGICGALCLGYFVADRKRPEPRGEVLSLAFVSVISMLVVYHRIYDAAVLFFPLAWAAREVASRRVNVPVMVTLAGCGVFLLPWASTLMVLADPKRPRIPASISESWWFTNLALPMAPIALLVLAVVLLAARRGEARLAEGSTGN
jgi:hypothetical protein